MTGALDRMPLEGLVVEIEAFGRALPELVSRTVPESPRNYARLISALAALASSALVVSANVRGHGQQHLSEAQYAELIALLGEEAERQRRLAAEQLALFTSKPQGEA